MNFTKNRKGFTLVELVVVIAILGILAGLAIPRFMDATISARGAKVAADLRIIETALTLQYAEKGTEAKNIQELVNNNYLASVPTPITAGSKFKIGDYIFVAKTSSGGYEIKNDTNNHPRATFDGNTVEKYIKGTADNASKN
ncbi:type II secretion system protein [Phascolarctobacterium faecium]|uniref:type II secretion system protein n=1 Tax=Phascolarctobacterium faecium TaxID=33025 RepID=UPI00257B7AAA|nr:prepilin-type N-terminal cleavage/methylation domain-containing protein [Phascolarctobacterium sp.]